MSEERRRKYEDDFMDDAGDDGGDDDGRGGRVMRRSGGRPRRKMCKFCADETISIDYKNPQLLRSFVTDRGKVIPRRITGNCATHQRKLAGAIKRSRMIALMPFSVTG